MDKTYFSIMRLGDVQEMTKHAPTGLERPKNAPTDLKMTKNIPRPDEKPATPPSPVTELSLWSSVNSELNILNEKSVNQF